MYKSGEDFLDKIYADMRNSEIVNHTALKSDKPEEKIRKYMDRLERVHKDVCKNNKLFLLKKYYYDKYVIKAENIPESYFKHQEQIALDRGYGHMYYTDKLIAEEINRIILEQRESLNVWIDYFLSPDASMYPTWFKYYCFQGVIKIGNLDKKINKFTKRTDSTIKPFIEINREAIALIYDALNNKNNTDKKLKELIDGGSFSKIYVYAIQKIDSYKKEKVDSDEGIWKKYDQWSDPNILFNDIHGKGTGWCTAGGLATAKTHLDGGDFYVYYTKNENNAFVIPRIAIRTEYGEIAEIRGIAENQNLESNMEKTVEKKLEEFPDKDEYKKKVKDMEMLTYIYTKYKNNGELTENDLRFLYEIDSKIMGFGYEDDPRIKEIIDTRDKRTDLAIIFNCHENQIALTEEEAINGNIVCCYGHLNLEKLTNTKGLELPRVIIGSLVLSRITSSKELVLPDIIKGDLYLDSLISSEGLKIPKYIGGKIYLSSLTSAKGLVFPEILNDDLDLESLTSVEDIELPHVINGCLNLYSLRSAEGIRFPEMIGGSLNLNSLTSAISVKLPETIKENLYLSKLKSAEGLIFPKYLGGCLDLCGLITAKGLNLPKEIKENLYLSRLKSAEGLVLPRRLGRCLNLAGLISANGLVLPDTIEGTLILMSLINVEGLIIPDELNCALLCELADNDINILKQMCTEKNNQKQLIKNN